MAQEINNNKSYTNKDFQAIYSELLDLIPSLTNRWNPSSEADPGVVLVKLMAVLGDKLNYNIDKQILECFPGSVTQRKNARQMFNLIGYKMPWYRAATTSVGFKLKDFALSDSGVALSVVIPRFTQLTDVNNSLSFFTNSEVVLYGDDITTVKHADVIQGNLVAYTINDTTQIKLSNLDENYKLYLTDINVAENGIFIRDYGASVFDWQQVDNVDSYPLGAKVYEFGISDDESQCYLKFPVDVNDQCISDSLEVFYITCDGKEGNIVSSVLSNFAQEVTYSDGQPATANIAISQPISTRNGEDPESIEEAYANSRKVVGTFDTLVTKKDFQNYIKLLEDDNNKPYISNVVVADRNNDFNNSLKVKSLENFLTKDRTVVTNIAAYDLIAYMLRYQPIYLDDDLKTCDSNYNASYQPVSDETTKLIIDNILTDVKAINIDLNLTDAGTSALYKGVYAITAEIVTTEKVTRDEATELETTIKKKLEETYQAYNMEFGKMVNYSDLIEVITQLDSRIKAVSLRDIKYKMQKVVMGQDTPIDLSDSVEDKREIVAKSIARGNVQAYKLNDTFAPEFGQTGSITTPTSVSTSFTTTLSQNNAYTLKSGQVINMYAPKVSVSKSYAGGCRVIWTPSANAEAQNGVVSATDGSNNKYLVLQADTYFKVGDDGIGSITITYKDSNNLTVEDRIEAGRVIRCNQNIRPTEPSITGQNRGLIISTGNQLDVYDDDKFVIPYYNQYLLYLDEYKNNESYIEHTLAAGAERMLGVNDYLVYYESVSMSWVQLGSGYTIKNETSSPIKLQLVKSSKDLVDQAGSLSSTLKGDLTVTDNDIITLNEGCKIELTKAANALTISSSPVSMHDGDVAAITDSSGTFEISSNPRGVMYKISTRLDIIFSASPVSLNSEDTVTTNLATYRGSDGYKLSFSKPVTIVGGSSISLEGITLYAYKVTGQEVNRVDGVINISATTTYPVSVTGSQLKMFLPIFVKEGGKFTITQTGGSASVISMDQYRSGKTKTNVYEQGNYLLNITNGVTGITFTRTSGEMQIGKLIIVDSINADELSGVDYTVAGAASNDVINSSSSEFYQIINKANTLAGAYKINYAYDVPSEDKCASPTDTESFFDANHVYNGLTIAQMDTENYKIVVNKFSIRS